MEVEAINVYVNLKTSQGGRGAAVARLIPAMEAPEGHPFKSGRPHLIPKTLLFNSFFKKINVFLSYLIM